MKYGIPCSLLKNYIKDEIPCTSEDEAMAIAAGEWLAGGEPKVYMQNSGLGHTVDIITSLYKPYKIPLPKLLLSVRCTPFHHSFMHNITEELLNILDWKNVEKIYEENRSD